MREDTGPALNVGLNGMDGQTTLACEAHGRGFRRGSGAIAMLCFLAQDRSTWMNDRGRMSNYPTSRLVVDDKERELRRSLVRCQLLTWSSRTLGLLTSDCSEPRWAGYFSLQLWLLTTPVVCLGARHRSRVPVINLGSRYLMCVLYTYPLKFFSARQSLIDFNASPFAIRALSYLPLHRHPDRLFDNSDAR